MLRLIAAYEKDSRGIGYRNQLPWNIIPEDMEHFRGLTINNTIVMGHETFLSFGEIPLPKRKNVVLTREKRKFPEGVVQIYKPEQVLKLRGNVFIIGGSSIFSMFIEKVGIMYITEIEILDKKEFFRFDRYFPTFIETNWEKTESEWKDSINKQVRFRFLKYRRIK